MRTVIIVIALLASACTPPTSPSRNPDGTAHQAGDPLQPWVAVANAPVK